MYIRHNSTYFIINKQEALLLCCLPTTYCNVPMHAGRNEKGFPCQQQEISSNDLGAVFETSL